MSRPLGSKNIDRTRLHEILEKSVDPEKLILAAADLAIGVYREAILPDAVLRGRDAKLKSGQTIRVYQALPDTAALKLLVEHWWGRAPESVTINQGDEGASVLVYTVPAVDMAKMKGGKK